MKTIRCFLAVNLALKAAQKISEIQKQLIKESDAFQSKIKWVPAQNMHVTVRFLGNLTEPMIQAIKDGLEPITQTSTPFVMETGTINVFDANDLRVLYAAITDPSGGLNQLVTRTHEMLENVGFKGVEKPYTPHITMARIGNGVADEIEKLLSVVQKLDCGESIVRDLACYESKQSEKGVDYQLLWKLPLQKRMPKEPLTADTPSDTSSENDTSDKNTSNDSSDHRDDSDSRERTEQGEQEQ